VSIFCALKSKNLKPKTFVQKVFSSPASNALQFTISEVAADWHEPMVLQRLRPYIVLDIEQLESRCRQQTYHRPNFCSPSPFNRISYVTRFPSAEEAELKYVLQRNCDVTDCGTKVIWAHG